MTKKIAVVGSGVSGLGAAWALRERAEVHLYEREPELGGHAHTVEGPEGVKVDVGFIVFNERTYPNLVRLFRDLGVASHKSDMSFGVRRADGHAWSSRNLTGLTKGAKPGRLARLARDSVRFKFAARASLRRGDAAGLSLGEWLKAQNFSAAFRDDYLIPMTAAIWSTPLTAVGAFPAEALLRFMVNHALTDVIRPQWRTVTGGSRTYVDAILHAARPIRRGEALHIRRLKHGAEIHDGREATAFDAVIMAGHPDETLAVLSEPDPVTRTLLAKIRYGANRVILHTDESLMPEDRDLWASWCVLEAPDGRACISYWMNKLQGLKTERPVIVTLNPIHEPRRDRIVLERSFSHPIFDRASIEAQRRLGEIQGRGGVYFAGAWLGYGFHEDGLASGLWAAERLGARTPWRPDYGRLAFLNGGAHGARGEDAMATA